MLVQKKCVFFGHGCEGKKCKYLAFCMMELPQYLTWWYLHLQYHSHLPPLPSSCFHYSLLLVRAEATGCRPLWSLWTDRGPAEMMMWQIIFFSVHLIPWSKTKSVTRKSNKFVFYKNTSYYLSSNSWEFEGLECFVVDGGTWTDVDHHAGGSSATEETLQDPGEFTVPEGNHLRGSRPVGVLASLFINHSSFSTNHSNILQ